METVSSPAFILRRIDHGDFDLILSFFTSEKGKISAIAKYAKKSKKRFAGLLEPFTLLDVVLSKGRGKLPVLQEASIKDPFSGIRANFKKTSYASYWTELLHIWLEEGVAQKKMFSLCREVMGGLDQGEIAEENLSLLFQIKFLTLAGLSPWLDSCAGCRMPLDRICQKKLFFDLGKGGLVCNQCSTGCGRKALLSKGAVKMLLWMREKDSQKALRMKFSAQIRKESLEFLEAFVAYHLGKQPKSLAVLRQLCRDGENDTRACRLKGIAG